MDIALQDATKLARLIANRELSSRELLENYLARVEKLDPELNAVITLDVEPARARADELDNALARTGPVGPLHGLPITLKDCLETAGIRTTAGVTELSNHVPAMDADVVALVKAAGAVVFGKTNVPPWAIDHQTYNDLFGATNNPWDLSRSPGGSSGGAAVAVAAGMTSFEIGSDIANSIRGPASHCGIYGHKSTFGVIPYRGHIPPPPGWLSTRDITVLGPMARSADDLDLVMTAIADVGPDTETRPLSEWRVAAWLDDETFPVAPDVVAVLEASVKELERAGAKIDRAARPGFSLRDARTVFNALLVAAGLPEVPDAEFELARKHLQDDGPWGTWARNLLMDHGQWVGYNEQRAVICAHWAQFFRDFDVLLTPAMPLPAIRHDPQEGFEPERTIEHRGVTYRYFDQSVWAGLSGVAYLPSTVAPAGVTDEGLPVGVQIVGRYGADRTTIGFARELAKVTGGYEPPPMAR